MEGCWDCFKEVRAGTFGCKGEPELDETDDGASGYDTADEREDDVLTETEEAYEFGEYDQSEAGEQDTEMSEVGGEDETERGGESDGDETDKSSDSELTL